MNRLQPLYSSYFRESDKLAVERCARESERDLLDNAHKMIDKLNKDKSTLQRQVESYEQSNTGKVSAKDQKVLDYYLSQLKEADEKLKRDIELLEQKTAQRKEYLMAQINGMGAKTVVEPAHILDKRKRICEIESDISLHEMTIEGFKKVHERIRNGEVLPPQILPPLAWTPSKENQELEAELERVRASHVPDQPLGLQ
jgi:hypothetical protein